MSQFFRTFLVCFFVVGWLVVVGFVFVVGVFFGGGVVLWVFGFF